jgi:hypothetical protein
VSTLRTIVFNLLIAATILVLLLSMLNLGDAYEFGVAKWAISGLLSLLVIGVWILDARVFRARRARKFSVIEAIRIAVIPVLVIALTYIGFVLSGHEEVSEAIFFGSPQLPFALPFIASIVGLLLYTKLTRKFRDDSPRSS